MPKPRGREHTSLTETAQVVVKELEKIPGIKMIAPGIIDTGNRSSNSKYITVVYTPAGFEVIITGQSTQKVAVHTDTEPELVVGQLKSSKKLREFVFKERARNPGI